MDNLDLNFNMKWDWEHEITILEEERPLPMCDYIFKYIMGVGNGLIKNRQIEKTENPLKLIVRYEFFPMKVKYE